MIFNEVFRYENGQLIWLTRPLEHFASEKAWKAANTRCAGKPVGSIASDGYLRFTVRNERTYSVHRVIFFLHYGYWPEQIDHINGKITDNRIENLREANHSENMCNSSPRKNSSRKCRGVARKGGTFNVTVYKDKTKVFDKCFMDEELAELVAQEAQSLWHGKYAAHLNRI